MVMPKPINATNVNNIHDEIPGEKLVAGLFTLVFLGLAVAIGLYSYFTTKTPFKDVKILPYGAGSVLVRIKSDTPIKTKIEYGTSQVYLNETTMSVDFKTEDIQLVAGLLPDKQHFFRVIGFSPKGTKFVSEFYQY